MRLRVDHTVDRQFGTNSFLVEDEDTHDAVIIDANQPEARLALRATLQSAPEGLDTE